VAAACLLRESFMPLPVLQKKPERDSRQGSGRKKSRNPSLHKTAKERAVAAARL